MSTQGQEQTVVDFLTPYLDGKPDHMPHSGYETLVHFVRQSRVYFTGDFKRLTRLTYPLRLIRILPKSYSSLQAELTALKGNGKILHHLYGEDTLWSSLLSKPSRRPIIATFHRPPRVIDATMPFFWRRAVRKLAAIIVLSPEQLSFMRSVCQSSKTQVSLIPHGIDTDYFNPGKTERSKDLAICVGSYLRDYTTLARAMRVVSENVPKLKLVVVSVPPSQFGMETRNISFSGKVSDAELLGLYGKASFMVLPYASLTASNTMLEGMACGLPVICPRFDSTRYYMGVDLPTTYEPGDSKSLADKIMWLYQNDEERRKLGSSMRERVQLFSWPRIASMLRELYDQIIVS